MESYEKSQRDAWEQTRIIAYHQARPYFKHEQTKVKFMPLAWDNESKTTNSKPPNKERFEELRAILNLR